jgi:hypothetical protein
VDDPLRRPRAGKHYPDWNKSKLQALPRTTQEPDLMLVDALYLREKAHYCVALARQCPDLSVSQALEVLGIELMEKAAELEHERSLAPTSSDTSRLNRN